MLYFVCSDRRGEVIQLSFSNLEMLFGIIIYELVIGKNKKYANGREGNGFL